MSIKTMIIIIAVLIILGIAGSFIAFKFGSSSGSSAAQLKCADEHTGDVQAIASGKAAAEKLGREAQSKADEEHITELKGLMLKAQEAAATAAATAAESKARAARLNDDLKRLKNENVSVNTWSDDCLPDALLASLHPDVDKTAYQANCRAASGGDQNGIPANPSLIAPGH